MDREKVLAEYKEELHAQLAKIREKINAEVADRDALDRISKLLTPFQDILELDKKILESAREEEAKFDAQLKNDSMASEHEEIGK